MSTNMKLNSRSSITAIDTDAKHVIKCAFTTLTIFSEKLGLPHFHARTLIGGHTKGAYGRYMVYSFYSSTLASKE